jgi:exodeoxyribonuclease III
MKIATWNVNSLRVRIEHVCDWLKATEVDLLALQELKLTDDKFPKAELEAIGYHCYFVGQPTYNGVAILSRMQTTGAAHTVEIGNPFFPDEQKRLIRTRFEKFDLLSAYFPNGQALDSDKYVYKLAWMDGLIQYLTDLKTRSPTQPLVLAGDFNIAPEVIDTHDPAKWEGQILCSPPERERFQALIALGFIDSFRAFEQAPRSFSWWDYRELGFRKNSGLRIDHILVDTLLRSAIAASHIDKAPRKLDKPSDHTPVVTELTF